MKTALFLTLLAAGCATGKSAPSVTPTPPPPVCYLFPTHGIQICDSLGVVTQRRWDWPKEAMCPDSKVAVPTMVGPYILFTDPRTEDIKQVGPYIIFTDSQVKNAKIIVRTGYGGDTELNTAVGVEHARLTLKHGYRFLIAGHVWQTNEQIVSLAKGGMNDGMRAVIVGKYVYGAKRSQYVVIVGFWPAELDGVMRHDFEAIEKGIHPLPQE